MFRRRHEQRLGRHQAAANSRTRTARVVASAHRAGARGPSRDDQRLSESRRDRRCTAAGGAANQNQNRPFPWRCPPTSGQNRPLRAGVSTDPVRPPPPGRAPSASACEPYRELIVEALARGRNAVAIWQDLVDDHGFPARYASVRRFVVTTARQRPPRRASSSRPRPAKKARSTTARRPDGPRPRHGQVPTHAALRPDAGLLAQVGAAAGVALERADLGRAARTRVSPAGRHRPRHRPRQSERRRPHARTSTIPR